MQFAFKLPVFTRWVNGGSKKESNSRHSWLPRLRQAQSRRHIFNCDGGYGNRLLAVYLACTPLKRIRGFRRFSLLTESITYNLPILFLVRVQPPQPMKTNSILSWREPQSPDAELTALFFPAGRSGESIPLRHRRFPARTSLRIPCPAVVLAPATFRAGFWPRRVRGPVGPRLFPVFQSLRFS